MNGDWWGPTGRGMRWLSYLYAALATACVVDLIRAALFVAGHGTDAGGLPVAEPAELLCWAVALWIPVRILAIRWERNAAHRRALGSQQP